MNITEDDLKRFEQLTIENFSHNNGGTLYLIDKTLVYKILKDRYSFIEEIERNVTYQIENPLPNTPRIYQKLYMNGIFAGYIMEFISNAITFRSAISKKIPLQSKLQAIQDIYTALKALHNRELLLGDIHSDNFLITSDGRGLIIDLDYLRFPGDEFKFQQCYLIKPDNQSYRINISSPYTDNAKVFLTCLSLLLEVDLEKFISKKEHCINIEDIYRRIIKPLKCEQLEIYFQKMMNQEVEYFTDSDFFSEILSKKSELR